MSHYDVAVVGGGPVGCVAALAQARKGNRVLLLEANPNASKRFAGEWLHPPAFDILTDYAGPDTVATSWACGAGFAVFPDDGSDAVVLEYADGRTGFSIEHGELIARLRRACRASDLIDFRAPARVTGVEPHKLEFTDDKKRRRTISTDLIIGAAGRQSVVHQALGNHTSPATYSRMAGILLEDCELPHERYGHVFLGGPGPVLGYRVGDGVVRLCIDVPLSLPLTRSREAVLWDSYAPVLPQPLQRAFRRVLEARDVQWATNQNRPRFSYGRPEWNIALVGDAVGHHHPLTAIGMTLGFQDAVALAEGGSLERYAATRERQTRVPEMLAVALYEVFADGSDELVSIRQAVYEMWRRSPDERSRTMGYLACDDLRPAAFAGSFARAVDIATRRLFSETVHTGRWAHSLGLTERLINRCLWLIRGALRFSEARPSRDYADDDTWGPALNAARAKGELVEHPAKAAAADRRRGRNRSSVAIERGVAALIREQQTDGGFEGECTWCALLPAQYVLACALTGTEIDETRRRRLLLQFERTQLPQGVWGLHDLSEPYLFVTTMVYVAARLLGEEPDGPLLNRAHRFITDRGGVASIPSWGKFWLALLGLYGWEGVPPVLPEVWQLPASVPLHPSNYYCHTRLIYLGMASLYGESVGEPMSPALRVALRHELFLGEGGFERTDFAAHRHDVRAQELFTPPSSGLRLGYEALRALDRHALSKVRRHALRRELLEHIRFELRSTDGTCISPVNGLLNLIALYHHDPSDPDFQWGMRQFEGWIWEDDVDGTRVAGARSATWDTAFALQSLAAAAPHWDVTDAVEAADQFLAAQQIRVPVARDYERFHRIDPTGGFCFAGGWHGWPVSDCTAEAIIARLESPLARPEAMRDEMEAAVRFLLRTQCRGGGFGSYEPQRSRVELEWLNPAEMFGDSMTEHPYIECTASAAAALAAFLEAYPSGPPSELVREARARAGAWLRRQQRADGSFAGTWGVHSIYGTLFGIRGLLAAGIPHFDPAIRKACHWLRSVQRIDGGWGESHVSCLQGAYRPHAQGQVIQTAWAMMALLDASDPDFDAIDRGA
ncbi:MAG: FAD-dependent oxidoreductase, partial [Myxococcota bacterium]